MGAPSSISYLTYGAQSGVTHHIAAALGARGHDVRIHEVPGPLEWRANGRLYVGAGTVRHLMESAARFGKRALEHRWNTPYAFDAHSRRAGELLANRPEGSLILQNGALFSPGIPPAGPYGLLLDHTRALTMTLPPLPDAGRPASVYYGPSWRDRETALYRGARSIAAFSSRVARSLVDDYGVAPDRVHVVGAGSTVWPEPLERRPEPRTIAFVGRDFRRKGGRVLLSAFERLVRHVPDARLWIAGPTERLHLPPGAVQLGPIDASGLVHLLSHSAVFVLPTLREPFGLALLDAMACGLPCVGTRIEAVPEIVEESVTGLLVPPGDDVALAAALRWLLESPTLAEEMGRAGRDRVRQRFTWDRVAERLERCLGISNASERVAG